MVPGGALVPGWVYSISPLEIRGFSQHTEIFGLGCSLLQFLLAAGLLINTRLQDRHDVHDFG